MINGSLNTMVKGIKDLMGKKSTNEILKYLSSVALTFISNKYNLPQIKYDPMDLKNMIYHYNLNNNNLIDKSNIDQTIQLMNINRFVNGLFNIEDKPGKNDFMNVLLNTMNDNQTRGCYEEILNNSLLKAFDNDTIETSSIADNYEISSGGIYLPDKNIYTSTIEGCNLADAKNDYLTKRMELGENANSKDIINLLTEYYDKIDFNNVINYFN